MTNMFQLISIAAFSGLLAFNAHAATVYDELIHGDLSNDNLSPTSIGLSVGQNLILGSTMHEPSLDRDFFTVTVGFGQTLNAVVLSSYTNTDDLSFIGYKAGKQLTALDFSGVDGWGLIGGPPGVSVGGDLLAFLAGGAVGPGAYSFWLQETEGSMTYALDYQVAAVPPPAALPLFLTGLMALGARMRITMRRV